MERQVEDSSTSRKGCLWTKWTFVNARPRNSDLDLLAMKAVELGFQFRTRNQKN